jgi:ABC-type taurine transport system substrate-binding protein
MSTNIRQLVTELRRHLNREPNFVARLNIRPERIQATIYQQNADGTYLPEPVELQPDDEPKGGE